MIASEGSRSAAGGGERARPFYYPMIASGRRSAVWSFNSRMRFLLSHDCFKAMQNPLQKAAKPLATFYYPMIASRIEPREPPPRLEPGFLLSHDCFVKIDVEEYEWNVIPFYYPMIASAPFGEDIQQERLHSCSFLLSHDCFDGQRPLLPPELGREPRPFYYPMIASRKVKGS